MKNQNFGISILYAAYNAPCVHTLRPPPLHMCMKAFEDYCSVRKNGTKEDEPKRAFPQDGIYSWVSPGAKTSKVKYTEGTLDHSWMKEMDKSYVFRLERERQLDEVETNLRIEAPDLYAEIINARQAKVAKEQVCQTRKTL